MGLKKGTKNNNQKSKPATDDGGCLSWLTLSPRHIRKSRMCVCFRWSGCGPKYVYILNGYFEPFGLNICVLGGARSQRTYKCGPFRSNLMRTLSGLYLRFRIALLPWNRCAIAPFIVSFRFVRVHCTQFPLLFYYYSLEPCSWTHNEKMRGSWTDKKGQQKQKKKHKRERM